MFTRDLSLAPDTTLGYSGEINQLILDRYEFAYVWIEDKENSEAGYFSYLKRK